VSIGRLGDWHDEGMSTRVIAACDGACKGNPGPAGWGWVIADADGKVVRWESGPLGEATNNVAELTALERLLAATGPDDDLECRMDSQYAMNAVTAWLPNWKRNGWQTAAKKPVANKELVMRIDALLAGRKVKFVHVAAHQVDGDPLNAIADRAASAAATSQQASGGTSLDNLPEAPDETPRSWSSSKKQTTGPAGVITAKFPGTCRCGKPYKAGEKISKGSQGGWGHPDCAAA
jgi:ribonuclease HI